MKRRLFYLFISFFVLLINIDGQVVHFEIRSVPKIRSADSSLYIAGSFNNWDPKHKSYKFISQPYGYSMDLMLDPGEYEYKITRGGWDKGETGKNGEGVSNRKLIKGKGIDTVILSIDGWQDQFPAQPKMSTASSHVCILDTAFAIPQLNRTRRVWIYLPADYCNNREKYPVLYMHDGQNVFDNLTSYSGEWGVDEFLDTTGLKNCIVVGIDHGGAKRFNEYSGYDNERFGKGEGKAYVDFLVNTLRPFINKNYRTKKGREDTWIAGSSMGGLISLYAILEYPKIFGGAGVFSPAFWVAPKIYDDIRTKGSHVKGSIYFMCGKLEGSSPDDREKMVSDMLRAFQLMASVSKARMETVIRDDGRHNEATWRKEFPVFYRWLQGNSHR